MRTPRLFPIALLAAAALCACGAGGAPAPSPQPTRTIPLDLTGPRPTASLSLPGQPPVTAIFDSGAAASVIWPAYAARLGLPREGDIDASGPGGKPVKGYRTTLRGGVLGAAPFDPALAAVVEVSLPLSGISAVISPQVYAGRLVRFDFAASRAVITDKTAANLPPGPAYAYSRSLNPFAMNRLPTVDVALPNGRTITAVADTGSAGGLLLPLEMAGELTLAEPLRPTEPSRMVGVERKAWLARIKGVVRVGPLSLTDPEVKFAEGLKGPYAGIVILRQTVLVLDPAEYRNWVLPAEKSAGAAKVTGAG